MIPYVKFPVLNVTHKFESLDGKSGEKFSFSSNLEDIGSKFDVSIKAGTSVEVISEPINHFHPKYGNILLVKIKADVADDYHIVIKEFWVPVRCLKPIDPELCCKNYN